MIGGEASDPITECLKEGEWALLAASAQHQVTGDAGLDRVLAVEMEKSFGL